MDEQEMRQILNKCVKDSARIPLINGDVSEVETSYISIIKKELTQEQKIQADTQK